MSITINEAKKITAQALKDQEITFTKLTAKTISFTDLTRTYCIFVKIYGFKPTPRFKEVEQLAKDNGFRVETDYMFS